MIHAVFFWEIYLISSVRLIFRVSARKLDMARLPWDVKVLTI
jgi:hypothetical protein